MWHQLSASLPGFPRSARSDRSQPLSPDTPPTSTAASPVDLILSRLTCSPGRLPGHILKAGEELGDHLV